MGKNKSLSPVFRTVEMYGGDRRKRANALRRLARDGQKSGDFLLVGAAYCCLAEACHDLGDLDGIFTNALKAVALLKDSGEHDLIARAYASLGYAYTYQENNQMALVSNEKAYQIVRKHRIKGKTRIRVLNNLAISYQMLGDFRTSIRIMTRCLDLIESDSRADYINRAMCTLNLAECHKDNGEPEVAGAVLEAMADWIERVEYPPMVCDYYLRRAVIAYRLGERAKGDGFTDVAFTLIPGNVYPLPVYDDLRQVAHFLSVNGDRDRAGRILDLMSVFSEKNKGTMEQVFAFRTMADYYRHAGDFERASAYYEKLDALYERRMNELKGMQLNLHKRMQEADAEIRKLERKMRESETWHSLEPLTGLLNRSALFAVASEFIETAARRRQKVGAIFIDIDCFKECNDTYGHARGDEIIREVARACKAEETAAVRFARYGGDEFFGIIRGLTDDEIAGIARRICRRIREEDIPNEKNPNGQRITLSVGVANIAITDRTDTVIDIANYADKAVYYAKNAGKNAIYLLDYAQTDAKGKNASFVRIDF